ncbi:MULTISPECIES: hypothetical protein [unclassified Paenibacillus]|uniref:Uncharacterized protein n=1 Tax=Paenibacillus provencensis TaxID=441151 RepID=A0ABW3PNT4_9BACL|nr:MULTISPECIES: hypothetical protein [unclassified Paenibacillus]MCM3130308.1 hypothetical protein [Paenibacillus sp. MER 78]SFS47119.1 hypothetical protein SAMN04488601_101886 [Paenibacillus sp. 453mf]
MSTAVYRIIGLLLGIAVPFLVLWLKLIMFVLFLAVMYAELRKVKFPLSGVYFIGGMLVGSIAAYFI